MAHAPRPPIDGRLLLRIAAAVLSVGLFCGCGHGQTSLLEQIKEHRRLVVVTRNSPTTYYEGPHGPAGLEYELARRFARRLDAELEIVIPEHFDEILPMVASGAAHVAAAGLTVTFPRLNRVRFGPSYQEITQQLVYRLGGPRPRTIEDLVDRDLRVVAGSSHAERLEGLSHEYPGLQWTADRGLEIEELLHLVWMQLIDYTVADSNEVALNRRFYPELRVAFDLTGPQSLAWAFAPGDDRSLYNAAVEFFEQLEKTGQLERLLERYYGYVRTFDYVDTRTYLRHIEQRLPRYRPIFELAARRSRLDWHLLAAIGYQESHWRPQAKSPTGVRGIMMLTLRTARQLNVESRLDPRQSILGAARYLSSLKGRLPDRIPEPDRTWMALAAYNVGFGHLEDARMLTQRGGGDPDNWVDVKRTLPLLTQRQWYEQTRHGYARGREPVRFVENVRRYHDLLVSIQERNQSHAPHGVAAASPTGQP
jgi:membrane-bound lytic murein transglycosylase F